MITQTLASYIALSFASKKFYGTDSYRQIFTKALKRLGPSDLNRVM